MDEGLISRRYAKALLKFAQDRGTTDQIYEEVKKFEENFVSHPELQKALLNPVLSAKDKESLLAAAVGVAPGEDYLRFVRLVIHNRREAYIRSIYLMYQELYRELKQIAQVRIITALPGGYGMELNEEAIGKIKSLILQKAGQEVEFIHEVDPSIIGGFIVRVDSMQLDASVNKELKLLRLKLLNSKKQL